MKKKLFLAIIVMMVFGVSAIQPALQPETFTAGAWTAAVKENPTCGGYSVEIDKENTTFFSTAQISVQYTDVNGGYFASGGSVDYTAVVSWTNSGERFTFTGNLKRPTDCDEGGTEVGITLTTSCSNGGTYEVKITPPGLAVSYNEPLKGALRDQPFQLNVEVTKADGTKVSKSFTVPAKTDCGKYEPPCENCHLSNCAVGNVLAWPVGATGAGNGFQWVVKTNTEGTPYIELFNVLTSLEGQTLTLEWQGQTIQVVVKDLQAIPIDRCEPVEQDGDASSVTNASTCQGKDCPPAECLLIPGSFVQVAHRWIGLDREQTVFVFNTLAEAQASGLNDMGIECSVCAIYTIRATDKTVLVAEGSTAYDIAVAIQLVEKVPDVPYFTNRQLEQAQQALKNWNAAGKKDGWYSYELPE